MWAYKTKPLVVIALKNPGKLDILLVEKMKGREEKCNEKFQGKKKRHLVKLVVQKGNALKQETFLSVL